MCLFLYLGFLVSVSKIQHAEVWNISSFLETALTQVSHKHRETFPTTVPRSCLGSSGSSGKIFMGYKKKHSDPVSFQNNLGIWAFWRSENWTSRVYNCWVSPCKRLLTLVFPPLLTLQQHVTFPSAFHCFVFHKQETSWGISATTKAGSNCP